MNESQRRILNLGHTLTSAGLVVGFLVACIGLFESGLILEGLLSVGVGIMAGSVILFGFGLVLALLEEALLHEETGSTHSPDRDTNTA